MVGCFLGQGRSPTLIWDQNSAVPMKSDGVTLKTDLSIPSGQESGAWGWNGGR